MTSTPHDSSSPANIVQTQLITSSVTKTTQTNLDSLGRPVQTALTSDPSGTTYSVRAYDSLGRSAKVYNPTRCNPPTTNCSTESTWGYTNYNYDALSRVTSVVEQDLSTVLNSYNGNCITTTDEAGKSRKSCADALGRITGVWEDPGSSPHLNYETDYAYDALGNLLCAVQKGTDTTAFTSCASAPATWRPRSFVYDGLSRLTSATNPESGTISYTYDLNGNVATKTAPLPNQSLTATVTTTYSYDALNRLTGKTYKDGTVADPYTSPVLYGYDGVALTGCTKAPPILTDTYPLGRRTSMCDGSGATSWLHDQVGRIMQDDRFIGSVTPGKFVNYGYNLDGSLAFVTTPPLKTVAYTYNGAEQPVQAVDNTDGINFATNATYAPPGELFNLLNGGTIHAVATYNSRLQPLQMYYGTNTPPALTGSTCPSTVGNIMHRVYNFSLGSGDSGNALSIANCRDATRSQGFTYDALNRINSAQSSGSQWGETFTIDTWGSLTNESQITGKTNHEGLNTTAGPNNQLAGFGYDAAGNMTSNTAINATYVYDAENRLIWTSGYRYVYDGDGKRAEKCVAATSTTACPTSGTNGTLYWRGIGSNTLDESDLSGNPQEEYVFFNGQRIARRDVTSTGVTIAVHYYFSDHLGTHAAVTDATGTQIEQDADYYPYGGVQHDYAAAPVAQHYKFTGKERDTESGLDDFDARHYASTMGRFMQPDPVGGHNEDPQTLNRYAYVRNNPLSLTDPTGLDFYLSCQTASNTCGKDAAGNLVQGTTTTTTDANGNTSSSFNATVVTSASLQDPNSGNTGTVNQNGVQITSNGQTSEGIFINGTPSADLAGSGKLEGFLFNVNGSDEKSGNLDYGNYVYTGSRNQSDVVKLLGERGGFQYGPEKLFGNYHHEGELNFRFSSGAHPNLFNYGPSLHMLVSQDPRATVPVGPGYKGNFHVDAKTGPQHSVCAETGVGCTN
jgi:RHS repeat-associated protein